MMMVDNQNGASAAAQIVVPELPASFRNRIRGMGGSNVVLVIQKKLTQSDTGSQYDRFSMPEGQIMNDFLEAEEEELLVDRNQPIHKVRLIHPCVSKVTNVTLRKGHMNNASTYNLSGTWRGTWHKQVVGDSENALQDGTMVQLYAFRRRHKNINELCFALVNLDIFN
ncbi:hypothetical protein AB3S75_037900 [Citrus x aurantiifolia]